MIYSLQLKSFFFFFFELHRLESFSNETLTYMILQGSNVLWVCDIGDSDIVDRGWR